VPFNLILEKWSIGIMEKWSVGVPADGVMIFAILQYSNTPQLRFSRTFGDFKIIIH
jgi:hypothetical protein